MALSNAERQARYRERLQKRASLDGLGEQARRAADRAVEALWSFYSRPGSDGRQWAELDGFDGIADFRASLEKDGDLLEWCRQAVRDPEDSTDDELAAWRAIVETGDAIALKSLDGANGG